MMNPEDRRAAYVEKFKDPRWQKIRLQVFERDKWTCQQCRSTSKTLNVHHRYYDDGAEPWEYDLDALVTLCGECHEAETAALRTEQWRLIQGLKKFGFDSMAFQMIADLLLAPSVHEDAYPSMFCLLVFDILYHRELWNQAVQLREAFLQNDRRDPEGK
jgi:hypothetical protein